MQRVDFVPTGCIGLQAICTGHRCRSPAAPHRPRRGNTDRRSLQAIVAAVRPEPSGLRNTWKSTTTGCGAPDRADPARFDLAEKQRLKIGRHRRLVANASDVSRRSAGIPGPRPVPERPCSEAPGPCRRRNSSSGLFMRGLRLVSWNHRRGRRLDDGLRRRLLRRFLRRFFGLLDFCCGAGGVGHRLGHGAAWGRVRFRLCGFIEARTLLFCGERHEVDGHHGSRLSAMSSVWVTVNRVATTMPPCSASEPAHAAGRPSGRRRALPRRS